MAQINDTAAGLQIGDAHDKVAFHGEAPVAMRAGAAQAAVSATLVPTASAASATLGTGENGSVVITVDAAGAAGNDFTVAAALAGTADQALSAAINAGVIEVTLATDSEGASNDVANTATLVAAAVDALSGVSATASGTGADVVAEQATTSFTGGVTASTAAEIAAAANLIKALANELRAALVEKGLIKGSA
jgi:hypothetical protein